MNNAGTNEGGWSFEGLEEEGWQKVLDVNLKSIWLVSQPVVKGMIDHGGGVIINIASLGAYKAGKLSGYGVTKNGVRTRSQRHTSVSVSPGGVETDMTRKFYATEEQKEKTKNSIP